MDLNQIVREQLGRNRILMGNVLKKLEAELEGEPILKMGAGRQGLRNAVVAVTPTRVLVANDKSVDAIPREDVLAIDARSAATGTKLAIRRPAGECTVAAFGPMLRGTEIRDLVRRP